MTAYWIVLGLYALLALLVGIGAARAEAEWRRMASSEKAREAAGRRSLWIGLFTAPLAIPILPAVLCVWGVFVLGPHVRAGGGLAIIYAILLIFLALVTLFHLAGACSLLAAGGKITQSFTGGVIFALFWPLAMLHLKHLRADPDDFEDE